MIKSEIESTNINGNVDIKIINIYNKFTKNVSINVNHHWIIIEGEQYQL